MHRIHLPAPSRDRALAALVATALTLLLPGRALAAGPITSGSTVAGSLAGPSYLESWTFSGTIGDRVLIAAVTTSGAVNTNVRLRSPGAVLVLDSSGDRHSVQLTATGTWTLEITDLGLNDAGSYSLSLLNVTAGPLSTAGDPDGGAITSDQIRTGTSGAIADFDAFTFSANNGARVVLTGVATSALPYNTQLYLYPPGGGDAVISSANDRLDFQLTASGTWTVVIEDFALDHTGGYAVSYLNVSSGPYTSAGDTQGGAIASAESRSGSMSGLGDLDGYTFSGSNGDRVLIGTVTTSGALNTQAYLYPPAGGAPILASSGDRHSVQLTATGTWTLVVDDTGNDTPGDYSLSLLNVTAGPLSTAGDPDGGAITSDQIRTGTSGAIADFDAFTFSAASGARVVLTGVATSALPYNTQLYLYPPGGGDAVISSANDRLDFQLTASGTWTVVIEDFALDHTGGYAVSYLNVSSGPYTSAGDTQGGAIASAESRSGSMSGLGDLDGYTFSGSNGDRVLIGTVTTSGALNTQAYLYPPAGGAPILASSGDRHSVQLTATGTWTVVIDDAGNDTPGDYSLSLLNVTAGPLSTAGDPDGGAITSDQIRTGTQGTIADFDAFTFSAASGARVVLTGVATSALPYNTQLYLYPPGGGDAVISSANDRLDFQLTASGTWTVVIEDFALDHTGGYAVSYLNVSSGPYTSAGDTQGGAIASAESRSGSMSGLGDLDGYTFSGSNGDRVLIGTVTTSGALNTQAYLYPPAGGAPILASSGDRHSVQLTATGTWTVVIDDAGNDTPGDYSLSLLNVTAGPLSSAGDPDGGAITSDQIRTGTQGTIADFDAFTFSAASGARVVLTGVATSALPYNTQLYLYPPGGGDAVISSANDRLDFQLTASGTWTVVIEDFALDHTGGYAVSYLNVSSGPYTSAGDTQGGAIASGETRNGQVSPIPDLDGYWFSASAGDTARITAITTSGALNTNIYVYPPGGGAPILASSADNQTLVLTTTGTHVIVLDDTGNDHTGGYQLTLSGNFHTVDVPLEGERPLDPVRVVMGPGFPNPARGASTLTFSLPGPRPVDLRIYDVRGALVRTLAGGPRGAGVHREVWDGRDDRGGAVRAGVYYAVLEAGGQSARRKLVRLE